MAIEAICNPGSSRSSGAVFIEESGVIATTFAKVNFVHRPRDARWAGLLMFLQSCPSGLWLLMISYLYVSVYIMQDVYI